MAGKHLQEQLEQILTRLNAPVEVIGIEDSAYPHTLKQRLTEGDPVAENGRLYLAIPGRNAVFSCLAEHPGARDVLLLAGELVNMMGLVANASTGSDMDVYALALRGEINGSELEALCHEHHLPEELKRCVMVFHIVQTDHESAYDLLKDITPLQERDVLIDMDRHSVVLIKDVSEEDSVEEQLQYAQALQETLMGETARQMTVGIGRSRHTMGELRESYTEARRAIEVGRNFKPEESIFVFSRLILERFLMELPQDISAFYHGLLFNRKNQRLFNEEMLYTIDMFFKKDLNLSDTARQLYIHRNTLVYRLDKVQKQTGLDLRSFEDAVTFKILMELKKVGGDRTNSRK